MLIINETNQIQDSGAIFERSYDTAGAVRRCIEIFIPAQEGITHDTLAELFADGAAIVRREITTYKEPVTIKEATEDEEAVIEYEERERHTDYDLSNFCVAGDIVDKRDGSFVVYMGVKTEEEKLTEQIAELLLEGGAE